jgi:hypothetical protein
MNSNEQKLREVLQEELCQSHMLGQNHAGCKSSSWGDAFAETRKIEDKIISHPYIQAILNGGEWISVDEAEKGKTYLVWFLNQYGKKRVCKAYNCGKFDLEASDDVDYAEDWGELNIEDGIYYCPEGWYETNEYDEKQC